MSMAVEPYLHGGYKIAWSTWWVDNSINTTKPGRIDSGDAIDGAVVGFDCLNSGLCAGRTSLARWSDAKCFVRIPRLRRRRYCRRWAVPPEAIVWLRLASCVRGGEPLLRSNASRGPVRTGRWRGATGTWVGQAATGRPKVGASTFLVGQATEPILPTLPICLSLVEGGCLRFR
jgi:hypothetical protein